MSLHEYVCVKPWSHQVNAFEFLRKREFGALFSAMGTGKSLVAIALTAEWGNKRNLIVCPASMVPVWKREIENMSAYPFRVHMLEGKLTDRINTLMETYDDGFFNVYIINYEAVVYKQVHEALAHVGFETVILDESHRIKTPSSQTSRAMLRIAGRARRKLIMTGTPAADKPTDIFMQMRFLSTSIFGGSYTPFFEQYVDYRQVMNGGARYKEILGYKNLDQLGSIIDKHSFRVDNSVLDLLPEVPPMRIPVRLSVKAKTAYRKMLKESFIGFDEGEVAATNVLTRMLRLQEITSGYIRADAEPGKPNRPVTIVDDAKLKATLDLLEAFDPTEPVVIFYKFGLDGDRLGTLIGHNTSRPWMRLNGMANELDAWKEYREQGPVLISQLQAGSTGVSMVEASKVIYYSHSFSLATFEQSMARSYRPGQLRPVHYYHLVAPDTIDTVLLEALESKKVTADGILNAVRSTKG